MEYYWNNVPGAGLCRNNLIYTSLISKDEKHFVNGITMMKSIMVDKIK